MNSSLTITNCRIMTLIGPPSGIVSGKLQLSASCRPWELMDFLVSTGDLGLFSSISLPDFANFMRQPHASHHCPDCENFAGYAREPLNDFSCDDTRKSNVDRMW